MKKIIVTLAFFASLGVFAQSNVSLTELQSAKGFESYIDKDVEYLQSLIELSDEQEKTVRELMQIKYTSLKRDASQEELTKLHNALLGRVKVVLSEEQLTTLAETKNAIPSITGLVYLNK